MRTSIFIASILAIAVIAAPTPADATPAACTIQCCQSLQKPNTSSMSRLLGELGIIRNDTPGLIGVLCSAGACPTRIVGVQACCSGTTVDGSATTGCKEDK